MKIEVNDKGQLVHIDEDTGEVLGIIPYIGSDGVEVLDPRPMSPPVGHMDQPNLYDQIRMAVLSEKLRDEMNAQGVETFEEADDFDVGDDFDINTPWENEFDPPYREIVEEVGRLVAKGVEVPDEMSENLERASTKVPVREDQKPKKTASKKADDQDGEGNN